MIKKILNNLILFIYKASEKYNFTKFIGIDKVLHFTFSFIICASISLLLGVFEVPVLYIFLISFGAGMCIGVGKEFGDYFNPNSGWDNKDLVADLVGCFFGALISLLFLL